MDERQMIKLTLKGEIPEHVRAWEKLQGRDMEGYPTPTDYIVSAIISYMRDDSGADKEQEKPSGLSETEFRKWESILLEDMEKKFRIIPRGPVGK